MRSRPSAKLRTQRLNILLAINSPIEKLKERIIRCEQIGPSHLISPKLGDFFLHVTPSIFSHSIRCSGVIIRPPAEP